MPFYLGRYCLPDIDCLTYRAWRMYVGGVGFLDGQGVLSRALAAERVHGMEKRCSLNIWDCGMYVCSVVRAGSRTVGGGWISLGMDGLVWASGRAIRGGRREGACMG